MLTPSNTTTTFHASGRGTLIDYGIASPHMGRMVDDVRACWDVPTRPHIGVKYVITQTPYEIMTRQLAKPRQIDPPKGMVGHGIGVSSLLTTSTSPNAGALTGELFDTHQATLRSLLLEVNHFGPPVPLQPHSS